MNKILNMDALVGLKTLETESIDMCVTSPPYWGLRDYGTASWEGGNNGCDHKIDPGKPRKQTTNAGTIEIQFKDTCPKCGAKRIDDQLGLEATPEEYIGKMVEIFREVRRVLKKEGSCWLNMGDSYNGSGGEHDAGQSGLTKNRKDVAFVPGRHLSNLKPKDLCGIPWMLAFALRADGWYLRQDIIWAKPNPMPESVTDRCTKSHEYLFLLTKSGTPQYWTNPRKNHGVSIKPEPDYIWRHKETNIELDVDPNDENYKKINMWRGHDYFYDADAIREKSTESTIQRLSQDVENQIGSDRVPFKDNGNMKAVGGGNRNKRSVWTINTQPYSEAHFATFPEKLVEPCIKAGTSEKGCCSECGKAWDRVVEKKHYGSNETKDSRQGEDGMVCPGYPPSVGYEAAKTIGWQPGCSCDVEIIPCVVLDPFGGAGTTGLVARKLGRNYIMIELSKDYKEIAERRLHKELGMFI